MELYVALLFLGIATFAILKERDILDPAFLISMHWLIFLVSYLMIDHGMYDLSNRVLGTLLILVIGFYSLKKVNIPNCNCNVLFHEIAKRIYYYICLIGAPVLVIKVLLFGLAVGFNNFFATLRLAVVGLSDDALDFGISKYVTSISLILLLIEIYDIRKRRNKQRIYVLVLINIICAISTVAKITFFCTLIPVVVVLHYRKIVRTRLMQRGSIQWLVSKLMSKIFNTDILIGLLLKKYKVECISHSNFVSPFRSIKSINWIPDFQYLHYPELWTTQALRSTVKLHDYLVRKSDAIILSSESALADYNSEYVNYLDKVKVVRFVSQ